jgi:hypothetical protein
MHIKLLYGLIFTCLVLGTRGILWSKALADGNWVGFEKENSFNFFYNSWTATSYSSTSDSFTTSTIKKKWPINRQITSFIMCFYYYDYLEFNTLLNPF